MLGDGPVTSSSLRGVWVWARSGVADDRSCRRLASFSRLILFDRRGTGLSDHVLDRIQQVSLETRMEDVRAVMDAADSTRAMLLALEGGGGGFPVAAMFAATLPERTAGLIAYSAAARVLWAPDYPFGVRQEDFDADVAEVERAWGTAELARKWVSSIYPETQDDPRETEELVAMMHSLGGPGDAALWSRVDRDTDLRDLLQSIRVPTLVIHRRDDRDAVRAWPVPGRAHPGAELEELPGAAHAWDAETTSRRRSKIPDDDPRGGDRARPLPRHRVIHRHRGVDGDGVRLGRRCCMADLLERHHHVVRGGLARYRGTEMDTAGDGFFATFDGPARAVRCAIAIGEGVRELGIDIRAGVHTGEVQTIDGKAGGIAVTIGARITATAGRSEVVVSQR